MNKLSNLNKNTENTADAFNIQLFIWLASYYNHFWNLEA